MGSGPHKIPRSQDNGTGLNLAIGFFSKLFIKSIRILKGPLQSRSEKPISFKLWTVEALINRKYARYSIL
jgi:hypothetical protein